LQTRERIQRTNETAVIVNGFLLKNIQIYGQHNASATINTYNDNPVSSQLKKQSKVIKEALEKDLKFVEDRKKCQALLVKSYVAKVTKKVHDSLWGL
jgi:hypothetical protein